MTNQQHTLDYKPLRDYLIKKGNLTKADEVYTFYYDETNNIRKFYLKEDGYNESLDLNFVLGGICVKDSLPDLEILYDALKLDRSTKEVKLKNIAQGDFEDCLKSARITIFLRYLLDNDLYVHFSVLNIFYYSLVDIIDSCIGIAKEFAPHELLLKNALYINVCEDTDYFKELAIACNYPNVSDEKLTFFLNGLTHLVESNETEEMQEQFANNFLLQLFKAARTGNKLSLIQDNEDHILIDSFVPFYTERVYLLKNASHLFDEEDTIKLLMDDYAVNLGGEILTNYSFIKSSKNRATEVSDIFVGLMGKFFKFISTNTQEEILGKLKSMNKFQIENIRTLFALETKADTENRAFINAVVSGIEHHKIAIVKEYIASV